MWVLAVGHEKAARRRLIAGQEELSGVLLDLGWASACSWFSLQEEVENASIKQGRR